MTPVAREEAASRGLARFFTAEPCKAGHIAERTTAEGKCVECRKASWEKVRRKQGSAPFRAAAERHAARESGAPQYEDGRPCPQGHIGKRWTHNSLCVTCASEAAKASAKQNAYAHQKAWAKLNREATKSIKRRHRQTDCGRNASRAHGASRRARQRAAEGRHTAADVQRIFAGQRGKCAHCRTGIKAGYHVDHIKSLSRGGSNWPRNLQLLCAPCNLRKHAHDPLDFAQREGRLL